MHFENSGEDSCEKRTLHELYDASLQKLLNSELETQKDSRMLDSKQRVRGNVGEAWDCTLDGG